jgi:hypothetical protein
VDLSDARTALTALKAALCLAEQPPSADDRLADLEVRLGVRSRAGELEPALRDAIEDARKEAACVARRIATMQTSEALAVGSAIEEACKEAYVRLGIKEPPDILWEDL